MRIVSFRFYIGPKIPEVKSNEQNKRPTETFWGPIHLRPTTGKDQKNDPFSLEFWDNPTEPTIYSYSPITTTEHYSRQPPGNINDAPGLSGKETPTSSSPPSLLSKEIRESLADFICKKKQAKMF